MRATSPLSLASIGFVGILAAAVGFAAIDPPAPTPPPISHTYVLTQANCLPPQGDATGLCKAQEVPVGAGIEIQLPGTPAIWTLVSASPNLTPTGTVRLPNPGRITGTGELFGWDFAAVRAGNATVVLREFPPTISTTPSGTFTYTFQVR